MKSLVKTRAILVFMLLSLAASFFVGGIAAPQAAHADTPVCSIDKTTLARGEAFTVTLKNVDPAIYKWASVDIINDTYNAVSFNSTGLTMKEGVRDYERSFRLLPSAPAGGPKSDSNPGGYEFICRLAPKSGFLQTIASVPVEITEDTKPHPAPDITISNVTENGNFSVEISPVHDSAQYPTDTGDQQPAANLQIAWSILDSSDQRVCGSEISNGIPSGEIVEIDKSGRAYPSTVTQSFFSSCGLKPAHTYKYRIWFRNEGYEGFDFVAPGFDSQEFTIPGNPKLVVTSGSGSGRYAVGTTVDITADLAPDGMEFDQWVIVSGNPTIANVGETTTTVTMPD